MENEDRGEEERCLEGEGRNVNWCRTRLRGDALISCHGAGCNEDWRPLSETTILGLDRYISLCVCACVRSSHIHSPSLINSFSVSSSGFSVKFAGQAESDIKPSCRPQLQSLRCAFFVH